jgi:hypothetical protein
MQLSLSVDVKMETKISVVINPKVFFLIRIVGGGVHTGSTRHVGHFWPIVPAPGDCEDGEVGEMKIVRGNSEKTCPSATIVYHESHLT